MCIYICIINPTTEYIAKIMKPVRITSLPFDQIYKLSLITMENKRKETTLTRYPSDLLTSLKLFIFLYSLYGAMPQ